MEGEILIKELVQLLKTADQKAFELSQKQEVQDAIKKLIGETKMEVLKEIIRNKLNNAILDYNNKKNAENKEPSKTSYNLGTLVGQIESYIDVLATIEMLEEK